MRSNLTQQCGGEFAAHVDKLFRANRKLDFAEIPVIGGHYCPREDDDRPLKKQACAALAARVWFHEHGPAWAQPLPLSYNEREDLKRGGRLHILAWYARSLCCLDWNYRLHPPFFAYACAVMAAAFTPDFIKNTRELQQQFPPRPLDEGWLNLGLCWKALDAGA
jgi:hypothetical protein